MTQTLIKFAEEVSSSASASSSSSSTESQILNTLQAIEQKQDAQIHLLEEMFQTLIKLNKGGVKNCVVDCCTTIPSLQPNSIPIQMVETTKPDEPDDLPVNVPSTAFQCVEEEEEEEEEEEVEVEVEEEGIEVEEWTYKGLLLFKDQNNTVYKNENGDVGDPIGTYDPVKKTLKKLATN
jgi:hypothetical protein